MSFSIQKINKLQKKYRFSQSLVIVNYFLMILNNQSFQHAFQDNSTYQFIIIEGHFLNISIIFDGQLKMNKILSNLSVKT
jgi:hypothetical protein